jgi:hypothetical protein
VKVLAGLRSHYAAKRDPLPASEGALHKKERIAATCGEGGM